MSGSVTVPGVSASTLSLSFVGSANVGLAQQISNALAAAATSSTLDVVNYTGGALPAIPGGDTTLELVLASSVSGSISVPAAPSGVSEILVVNNTQALTIHGSANLSIVGGGPGALTIDDPNVIDIGAGIGATGTVSMTLTPADSPYLVAMGEGFETVNAQGSGTITGGTGPNVINVSGPNDLIDVGSAATTVNATGFQASIEGSSSALTFNDAGFQDAVVGGTGALTASLAGFMASVTGTAGTLTATDAGFHDTVQAGAGTAAVTLEGFFGVARGGTGTFNVLDQTANNTIIGGTLGDMSVTVNGSNSFVFGRKGNVSVLDQASNVEIGSGGGVGAVTVDGANALIYGGPGTLTVSLQATDAIVGIGSAASTIDGSSAAATGAEVFAGYSNTASLDGSMVFTGGKNSVLVGTGGSNTTINAGSGITGVYIGTGTIAGSNVIHGDTAGGALYVQFVGGAGSATVFGGEGVTTLFGTDGTNANFVGSTATGAAFMFANGTAAGTETLGAAGSVTNDTLDAAIGNVSLVGGAGTDQFLAGDNTGSVGGAGTVVGGDTMTGGSGHASFVFENGTFKGAAVISNFSGSLDTVFLGNYNSLSGAGGNQANQALTTATVTGANTTIALADGTHITFVDTTVAQLQGHVFSS